MAGKRQKEVEINELKDFQSMARAYSQIASTRMKRTRGSVLLNREFVSAMVDVFDDVRASYAEEVLKLGTEIKGNRETVTFLSHNGKTVSVFLSANTGLFGDIIQKTFQTFLKDIKSTDSEVVIVGRLGKSMFLSSMPNHPYTYFDLSDTDIVSSEFSQIVKHVVQYEEIKVYHAQFKTAVTQIPLVYRISAETPVSELRARRKKHSAYLFEPNLQKILRFFEQEIFTSLMEQTIRESQLAKFASRILAMDRASENIKEVVRRLDLDRLRLEHQETNKKQLHSLSSISLWNS